MERYAAISREIERRWQLKGLPEGLLRPQEIEQFFILADGQGYIRARKTTVGDRSVFTLTVKQKSSAGSLESTTEIPESGWEWLKAHHKKEQGERKRRYHWERWVVDEILEGDRKGKIVAEFEGSQSDLRDLSLPPHFGEGKEVD